MRRIRPERLLFFVGKTRTLGYHLRPEAKMVDSRFMLVVTAISLATITFGCTRGPASEQTPPANEHGQEVLAEETNQPKLHPQWWRDKSIVAQVELTDDQVQVISDLMTVSAGDAKQQRIRERQLTLRYLRTLNQDPYDPAMADQMSEMLAEALSTKHRQRIANIRAMRDTLTHEQWTKLWEVVPRAFQIGRTHVLLGPRISVTDSDSAATPTP
jgi:Spy/CpxP family protein refolding chaperone